jgi:nitroreductase
MTSSSSDRIDMLETLLAERYSCRAFRPDPVPRPTIERILKAAQRTASWCNSQPWQVIVASGAAARRFSDAIYQAASAETSAHAAGPDFAFPREYKGVYLERRRESGFQLYNSLGIARGDKEGYRRQTLQNFKLFGAPRRW